MEKNMKLKQARDVILAYLMKEDFTVEETKRVLQMCNDEVTAWENRSKLAEIKKEGEQEWQERLKASGTLLQSR